MTDAYSRANQSVAITRRNLLLAAGAGLAAPAASRSSSPPTRPRDLVGYTEFRTNLPGGRRQNIITMRACVVRGDGAGRRRIGEGLASKPGSWTQFAGWSPDGRQAILGVGWESAENGAWEEQHRTFRMTEGWLYDSCLVDIRTGKSANLTAVDRVSDYNSGLFYFPGKDGKLGFQALIDRGRLDRCLPQKLQRNRRRWLGGGSRWRRRRRVPREHRSG